MDIKKLLRMVISDFALNKDIKTSSARRITSTYFISIISLSLKFFLPGTREQWHPLAVLEVSPGPEVIEPSNSKYIIVIPKTPTPNQMN